MTQKVPGKIQKWLLMVPCRNPFCLHRSVLYNSKPLLYHVNPLLYGKNYPSHGFAGTRMAQASVDQCSWEKRAANCETTAACLAAKPSTLKSSSVSNICPFLSLLLVASRSLSCRAWCYGARAEAFWYACRLRGPSPKCKAARWLGVPWPTWQFRPVCHNRKGLGWTMTTKLY